MINILVNGARGKMGSAAVAAIAAQTDLTVIGTAHTSQELVQQLVFHKPDVVIDFTRPESVFENALSIITHGARPVIGTSGLTETELTTLKEQCTQKKLGGIYAPNFSLGAVLMMKYAEDAARYFDHIEIIEMHHEKKLDAPSGTALHTQKRLRNAHQALKHIPIHSIRLPGIFAEQSVVFGMQGETFTLQHKAIDRQCMMPGILLACRQVMTLSTFVIGLEKIMG